MQKLDLSLDIPGAPIVRQAPPEPDLFDLAWVSQAPPGDTNAAASGYPALKGHDAVSRPLPGGVAAAQGVEGQGGGRRRPHLRAVPAPMAAAAPDSVAPGLAAPVQPHADNRTPHDEADRQGAHPAHGVPHEPKVLQAQELSVSPEDAQVRQKVLAALRDLQPSETSTVPVAATMAGDLVCKSIRVQGELCGSVKASGLVYLEDGAVLNGQILGAEIVILAGTVSADVNQVAVRCSGLVVLAQSARVVGHIQCRAVAIYEGACLVGTVQCLPSSQA